MPIQVLQPTQLLRQWHQEQITTQGLARHPTATTLDPTTHRAAVGGGHHLRELTLGSTREERGSVVKTQLITGAQAQVRNEAPHPGVRSVECHHLHGAIVEIKDLDHHVYIMCVIDVFYISSHVSSRS
jgi:hypothetical protein